MISIVQPRSLLPTLGLLLLAALAAASWPAPLAAQDDPVPLEGLIVTTSPTPRPLAAVASHVTVLEGETLRRSGVASVADALREVAGVAVSRGGSFGAATSLFLRGAESDHVQVLVDGVPVNQPGGSFDFAGLTLEHVERIEVVRGPMSALYGSDAVAGVVHVITRTGKGGLRGWADARFGSYGRSDRAAGVDGGSGAASWAVALGRYATDGILPFNNRHENTVLSATVRLMPDEVSRAEVFVRVAERVYHFPTDGSGVPTDRNAFTFGDETTVGLSARRTVGGRWRIAARVSVHETDGGTEDGPDGPADTLGFYGFTSLDHVRRAAADVSASLLLGRTVATLGAELEEQRQRSFTESLSEFGPSAERSEYERDNRAGYVHVTHDGARTSWSLGARLEDNQRHGTTGTWQAGLTWSARPDTRIRVAAGRGVKEPTFFETYATGFARGNPELAPERSRSVEVGADQSLAEGRVRLRGTLFRQTFDDLIQYTATPASEGDPNFFNVAAARASGLELSVDAAARGAHASASWTWLHSEVLDAGFDEGPDATFVPGEPLLRRPEHRLAARAGWSAGRASIDAGVTLTGSREDRDFSQFPARRVKLDRYVTVDVAGEVRVSEGRGALPAATLTLQVDNLLDEDYREVMGFDAPGRAFYVGARVSLGGAR
jgi:vitamin B12 transporter